MEDKDPIEEINDVITHLCVMRDEDNSLNFYDDEEEDCYIKNFEDLRHKSSSYSFEDLINKLKKAKSFYENEKWDDFNWYLDASKCIILVTNIESPKFFKRLVEIWPRERFMYEKESLESFDKYNMSKTVLNYQINPLIKKLKVGTVKSYLFKMAIIEKGLNEGAIFWDNDGNEKEIVIHKDRKPSDSWDFYYNEEEDDWVLTNNDNIIWSFKNGWVEVKERVELISK